MSRLDPYFDYFYFMGKVSNRSLSWALRFLLKRSDSDAFPEAFEYKILKRLREEVLDELAKIDPSAYVWNPLRTFLIPKDDFSFRRVSQLDPLDSIFYTAIVKEIARRIESRRIPKTDQKIFSHRVASSGQDFFDNHDNWTQFWVTSKERAESSDYVLITDIVDFYNQISHHTIENVLLDECGVERSHVKALINLFTKYSDRASRGIPVGPPASHLLAEVCLIGFDEYLVSKGYEFCRFVDDVHIFTRSEKDALIALSDVANCLDSQQKLILNRHKTKIIPSDEFAKYAAARIEDNPINDIEDRLLKILKAKQTSPYQIIQVESLSPKEKSQFSEENIKQVFEAYLDQDPHDYSGLRWFIRKLAQVGLPTAVKIILSRFEDFYPVIREVSLYLTAASRNFEGEWLKEGESLLKVLADPVVKKSEYLQMIILNLFLNIQDLDHIESILQAYDELPPHAQRKILLIASRARKSAWIRDKKQRYSGMGPWLRRAFIFSCSSLPVEEKRHYLRPLKRDSNDKIEKYIIEFLLSGT